jgi:hypothetical protein
VSYLTTSLTEKDDVATPQWIARGEAAADALIEWYSRSDPTC